MLNFRKLLNEWKCRSIFFTFDCRLFSISSIQNQINSPVVYLVWPLSRSARLDTNKQLQWTGPQCTSPTSNIKIYLGQPVSSFTWPINYANGSCLLVNEKINPIGFENQTWFWCIIPSVGSRSLFPNVILISSNR